MVTYGGRASRQKKQPVPSTEVEEANYTWGIMMRLSWHRLGEGQTWDQGDNSVNCPWPGGHGKGLILTPEEMGTLIFIQLISTTWMSNKNIKPNISKTESSVLTLRTQF